MPLAGSSLGHFLLLLLTGDSSCESGILELETSQRGLEIHLAGGIGALELQGGRGRGLESLLGLV